MHDFVARAVRGDSAALAILLEEYGPLIFGLCCAQDDDPEDGYQEIWAKVLRALPRFDPKGSAKLSTWICRIAQRHLIDRHRKRKVRRIVVPMEQEPAVAPALVEQLDEHQASQRLRSALLKLPPSQRRAVVAHYLQELSLKEIAELERVPVGTVKSRLHHGRNRLLTLMGDER